jgi:trans-aconitate methyltransferase
MDLGFSGEVVDYYHKYRRGYPAGAFDVLARTLNLTEDDIAVDLGCGTGQIAVPLAARVGAVIGMDPSSDMLNRARQEAKDTTNTTWLLGADGDLPRLTAILGKHSIAAITIGQALHWMDHEALFRDAKSLLRTGGGIAILTNGTPLWLQPAPWSHALKATLEQWLDTKLSYACGTDQESQDRYARALSDAGYDVSRQAIGYDADLTLDQIVGGVLSAASDDKLNRPNQRKILANNIRRALAPHGPFREHVQVAIIVGRAPEVNPITRNAMG